MIDILELKKVDYLKFYSKNGYIYCENINTEEKVIVSELVCDRCGKQDSSVEKCIDPYDKEVNDSIVPVILCDECYQERKDSI